MATKRALFGQRERRLAEARRPRHAGVDLAADGGAFEKRAGREVEHLRQHRVDVEGRDAGQRPHVVL